MTYDRSGGPAGPDIDSSDALGCAMDSYRLTASATSIHWSGPSAEHPAAGRPESGHSPRFGPSRAEALDRMAESHTMFGPSEVRTDTEPHPTMLRSGGFEIKALDRAVQTRTMVRPSERKPCLSKAASDAHRWAPMSRFGDLTDQLQSVSLEFGLGDGYRPGPTWMDIA